MPSAESACARKWEGIVKISSGDGGGTGEGSAHELLEEWEGIGGVAPNCAAAIRHCALAHQ